MAKISAEKLRAMLEGTGDEVAEAPESVDDSVFQALIKEATSATFTSDGEAKYVLHDVDRDMLRAYASRLHRALHQVEDPEPYVRVEKDALGEREVEDVPPKAIDSIVLGEIIAGTVVRVFCSAYADDNYGSLFSIVAKGSEEARSDPAVMAHGLIQRISEESKSLWDNIGIYEERSYGKDLKEVDLAFKDIFAYLNHSIKRHVEGLKNDPLISAPKKEGQQDAFKDFREHAATVADHLDTALKREPLKMYGLGAALESIDSFMEKYIREHLGGSDVQVEEMGSLVGKLSKSVADKRAYARKKAEAFVVDVELLRTVYQRYSRFKRRGYIRLGGNGSGKYPAPVPEPQEEVSIQIKEGPEGHYVDLMVTNQYGLHMRPAKAFVAAAYQYKSDIEIRVDGQAPIDGKSILDMIGAGIEKGTAIKIFAQGPDYEPALKHLKSVVENYKEQ